MSGTATRVAPEGLARRHHPPTLLNLSLINVRTLLNMGYLSHYYAELFAPEPRAETAELRSSQACNGLLRILQF